MGQKGVAMDTKLAAVLADVKSVTVTALCVQLGISRQSYYDYRRRFAAEGPPGLVERSRRPLTSPTRTSEAMVVMVLQARSRLIIEGWDWGALSIFYRMLLEGDEPPSARTIHRILVRQGLVVPQPRKRPRSSYRRFQFPATDDCWQLDAYEFKLADHTVVVIFELFDDCSRYLLANVAWPAETTDGAWRCVSVAIGRYGQPRLLLSDNSLAFTGRLHGIEVTFEKNLRALGIKPIHSKPNKPRTCGKNERAHRTSQRWLATRPVPATMAELQALLDEYRDAYNRRPHQALAGNTPLQQRAAKLRITPNPVDPPEAPTTVTTPTANSKGAIKVAGTTIGLGVEYAGEQLVVFNTDDHLQIYYRQYLVHSLTIDPNLNYQPPIRPRGGRRRLPGSSAAAPSCQDDTAVKVEPPTAERP
jgi:transposase InsO family protein